MKAKFGFLFAMFAAGFFVTGVTVTKSDLMWVLFYGMIGCYFGEVIDGVIERREKRQ